MDADAAATSVDSNSPERERIGRIFEIARGWRRFQRERSGSNLTHCGATVTAQILIHD
jgi:hypothetical protein